MPGQQCLQWWAEGALKGKQDAQRLYDLYFIVMQLRKQQRGRHRKPLV